MSNVLLIITSAKIETDFFIFKIDDEIVLNKSGKAKFLLHNQHFNNVF